MKLALISLTLAVSAWANPIEVTGSGTYFFGMGLGSVEFSVNISGSDGVNEVYASCDGNFFGGCGRLGGTGTGAGIDGQHFSPGFYSLDLSSSITGYDAAFNPVITQAIIGYIQPTSLFCSGPQQDQICEETFNVVATPEPSMWLLTAAGLVVIGWQRRGTQI